MTQSEAETDPVFGLPLSPIIVAGTGFSAVSLGTNALRLRKARSIHRPPIPQSDNNVIKSSC